MKQYIFLIPVLAILLAGCGQGRPGGGPEIEGTPAAQSLEPSPTSASDQATPESEMLGRLGELGFQTPSEELEAIDFSLEDLYGKQNSLSTFSGRVVFLNFWATWCGPCRSEIPSMEKLYQELRGDGFVIVAVNSQEPVDQVSAYVKESGMSFPVLLDSTGRVGASFGVRAIPTTYIVDSEGWIRARMVGARDWFSPEIVSLVKELLP